MIDIHCHILPAVDDGSASLPVSLAMARQAAASGVSAIIATPHCNLPGNPRDNYVSFDLRDRFVALCKALVENGIRLQVLPGSEIMCTPDLSELLDQRLLQPLAGSRYLLVEFYFDESPAYMQHMLDIVRLHHLVPIVAHPERYEAVQRDPQIVVPWLEQGCFLQLDKDGILGRFGHRAERAAHWLLSHGLVQLAASDAHDTDRRTPDLDELRSCLSQLYSEALASLLLESNPLRIIQNQPLQPFILQP